MSKLALGTVQFGVNYGIANNSGQVTFPVVEKILNYAEKVGIKLLDTAATYGESEEVLGKIGVGSFDIVSKFPGFPKRCANIDSWLEKQVAQSAMRLGVQSLHGILVHRSEDLKCDSFKGLGEALQRLKSKGFVQKIGVSIYAPSELDDITQTFMPDIVQGPLNLIDRRLESSGWLARLKQMGAEIHTRSSFLQGLLLMPRNSIPSQFERWAGLWDSWADSLFRRNISPLAASLSYPLANQQVDRVVVGVDSLAQLKDLVDASKQPPIAYDFNFMSSDDEQLINPSRWSEL